MTTSSADRGLIARGHDAVGGARAGAIADTVRVVLAAVVATQAKTWAEQVLQPAAEQVAPPSTVSRTRLGADPGGHPENMPPAELSASVARSAGHDPLSTPQRQNSSQVLHWVMGVGAGSIYGLLAPRAPAIARGRGTLFGALLFAATHASLLPALGAQARPSELPGAWWVWEPGSHLVYGVVLDTALRVSETRRA